MANRWGIVSRRGAIGTALSTIVSGFTFAILAQAPARQKMSKQEAEYQDSPKDIRMCATCTLFEPPNACKVVEGPVSPSGWCKAFALAD
jgi:hypothetical protein